VGIITLTSEITILLSNRNMGLEIVLATRMPECLV